MSRALWYGLAAAPLAWSAQELLGYGLSARGCVSGHLVAASGGLPMAPAEIITNGIAVAVALAGLAVAARMRSRTVARRPGFMAAAGILVSGVFLVGILMNLVGYFVVPRCG